MTTNGQPSAGNNQSKESNLGLMLDGLRNFSETSLFKSALTVLLFGVILMLCLSADFYTSTIVSAYLSLAMFSAVIVLGMIRRAWRDFVWVLAGTIVFYVLDYRVMGFKPMLMAGFSFAGLAAFAVLGVRTIWAKSEDRRLLLCGLIPLVLFVGSEWMATTLLDITERLHPKTFDLFLYAFDNSLHVQISFWVGQLFWKFQWLRRICVLFYIALPLPLALVYAARLRKSKPQALTAMIAFLVTGPVGVIFYNMLPACGPVHLFGLGFPFHPLSTADALKVPVVPVLIKGARNAIPSLHMAWVLLIWWNSKGCSRWVRAIALSFVWTTVLATLGTGEHYFVDLVVAFPFSLLIQALSSFSLPWHGGIRRVAFLFGALATFTWFAVLSFATHLFWISPVIPWTMIVATLLLSISLWHRLLQATPPELSCSLQPTKAVGIAQACGAAG